MGPHLSVSQGRLKSVIAARWYTTVTRNSGTSSGANTNLLGHVKSG